MGRVSRRVLRISPAETTFARRGFRCDSAAARERLEEVGRCFVRGYHLALESDGAWQLAARIESQVPLDFQGFGFEGAAMALTMLDALTPWRRGRLARFLVEAAGAHVYIVHIGAGWALARLPIAVERLLARLDPMLGWLALDGYGFHQGFFHWPEAIRRQRVPRRLAGYARRAFDQGVGRSLWFVEGTDVARIAADVAAFPEARRLDLWSGVGLACGYAGGAGREALLALRRAAGGYGPALAQGAAFAAKARLLAGNPTADTALACDVLCGMSVADAAAVTDRADPAASAQAGRAGRPERAGRVVPAAAGAAAAAVGKAEAPPFEQWRQRIQQAFLPEAAAS